MGECRCTICPFCYSENTMLLQGAHVDLCECLECEERWARGICCGIDCELDHDFDPEED